MSVLCWETVHYGFALAILTTPPPSCSKMVHIMTEGGQILQAQTSLSASFVCFIWTLPAYLGKGCFHLCVPLSFSGVLSDVHNVVSA